MNRITFFVCVGFLLFSMACDNYFFVGNQKSGSFEFNSDEGVAFYLIKNFDLQNGFEMDSIELENQAFIDYNDIVAYDSVAHVFELGDDVNSSFPGIYGIDLRGFVLMVDRDTVYSGLIVSPVHSQVFNASVVLTSFLGDSGGKQYLEIIEAYPSAQFASSPINLNDELLISRLAADHKLKILVEEQEQKPGPKPYVFQIDTLYYQHEILNEKYQAIYGRWDLNSVSGGITGLGYEPDFNYLEFKPIGFYQFVRADTLLEYGKIIVEEQSNELLKITFEADETSTHFFLDPEKYVELKSYKQLDLFSPCCDRYNYHFNLVP